MLHAFAKKLTQIFIDRGAIPPEDADIYIYGWEMILATAAGFLTMLFISFFTKTVLGTVAFMLALFFLRQYSGGYHANTFLACYLATTASYVLSYLIISRIPNEYQMPLSIVLSLLSFIIIFLRAPQEHPNRPMQEGEPEMFKKKTRMISCILMILIILFLFLPNLRILSLWISFAMAITALLLCVPISKTNKD